MVENNISIEANIPDKLREHADRLKEILSTMIFREGKQTIKSIIKDKTRISNVSALVELSGCEGFINTKTAELNGITIEFLHIFLPSEKSDTLELDTLIIYKSDRYKVTFVFKRQGGD